MQFSSRFLNGQAAHLPETFIKYAYVWQFGLELIAQTQEYVGRSLNCPHSPLLYQMPQRKDQTWCYFFLPRVEESFFYGDVVSSDSLPSPLTVFHLPVRWAGIILPWWTVARDSLATEEQSPRSEQIWTTCISVWSSRIAPASSLGFDVNKDSYWGKRSQKWWSARPDDSWCSYNR